MCTTAEGFLLSSSRISLPTGFLLEGIKLNPSTLFTSGGKMGKEAKMGLSEIFDFKCPDLWR